MNELESWWREEEGGNYAKRWLKIVDPATHESPYKDVKHLRVLLNFKDARSVLEVGCNAGFNLVSLSKWKSWSRIEGCDISSAAIAVGRRIHAIPLRQSSVFELGYDDNEFDLVFTAGVLIHIPEADLARALRELYRVAKKYLVLTEYDERILENRSAWNDGIYANRRSLFNHNFPQALQGCGYRCQVVKIDHALCSAFVVQKVSDVFLELS